MSDNDPKCGQCGLSVTTGMMAAYCPYGRECEFWPRAEKPEDEGAELLMAKFWIDNARDQIGLQIEDRKRLEREVAELREAAKRVLNAHLRDPDYFLDYEVVAARIEYNESRAALERLIYAPPAQGTFQE